jgi:hypothetical protein
MTTNVERMRAFLDVWKPPTPQDWTELQIASRLAERMFAADTDLPGVAELEADVTAELESALESAAECFGMLALLCAAARTVCTAA